jgi:hypothetical protein
LQDLADQYGVSAEHPPDQAALKTMRGEMASL